MNPAAKQFDIVLGVDLHLVQPPGPVPPIPIPHPFIGIVFDPVAFIPGIGSTILVNGVPLAQAGTAAQDIPVHVPLGGSFVKPPANEGEMFMGSATVIADGEPFTHMGHPVLSCHDIGMLPPLRLKKKGGAKCMMLPTSVVLPIPTGRPVLIGGPPTISMTGVAMKLGLGALGKGMKKFNSQAWKKGSDQMADLSKKLRAAVDKTPLSPGGKDRLKSAVCTLTGHPVNVAHGSVLTSQVDFEFPGPIPFVWERYWFSNSAYQGPLGHGWFHSYDLALEVQQEGMVVARLPEGRIAAFPMPESGNSYYHRKEKITLFNDGYSLYLRDHNLLTYHFKREGVGSESSRIHYLERIEDQNGFSIRFEYSRANVLSRVIDSASREFHFTSDEKGRITQIEAPHPDRVEERFILQTYEYDEIGNLVEARDVLDQPFSYTYHWHLLTRETNRNGLSFYFEYQGQDEKAKCYRTWGDGGIYDHKLEYSEGYTVVENSLGFKTTYFHEGGLVRKTVDAKGGVSLARYNQYNELLSEKNPLGCGPSYGYDQRGNLTLFLDPDGATTQTEYNALDLPVKAVDPVGGIWLWQYDAKGNLLQKTNPLGHTTQYHYQGGLLSEIINPAGGKTMLAYGQQHKLKMLISPDGQASFWSYDALGRCLETTDPKSNTQVRKYNLNGWVTQVQEPDGNVRRFRYDGEGNITWAKDLQHEVRFGYSGMNRMKTRIQAGTRIDFRYDTEEQLTGIINEQGYTYRFTHDATGDVTEEEGFDGIRRVYVRDAVGRVTEVQRPGKKKSFYSYDPADRILQVKHSDGTFESFAYRKDGALMEAANEHSTVRLERDILGQVIRERQGDVTVESVYDKLGMRTSVHSSLGADFTFSRNVMGDVNQISAGDFHVHFRRDALGLELEREFSGGLRSRWYRDRLGRPVKQETLTGGDFSQRTRTYQWQVNDRLQQIEDSQRGLTRFGHDDFGNLAWSENPDGSMLYRMPDAVGNLFRTQDRKDRKYGRAGQLLQSGNTRYKYDAEGNLIRKTVDGGKEWHFEWNASGMLRRVIRPDGETVVFTYDALGRRLSKTYRGRTTHWFWDGNTPLHEWIEPANFKASAKQLALQADADGGYHSENLVTWLFEPESFAPVAKLTREACYDIVSDHLGTPLSMHAATGEVVWSANLSCYGEVLNLRGKAEDCLFRFPGQYEDVETGLYFNRFRYYDPKEGLYLGQDPIGLKGGWNLYKYVKDPLVKCDPLGLNEIVPKDLMAFGNKENPRPPRAGKDITVDENGMVKSQTGKKFPQGASTFDHPNNAPLTGHYHTIPTGTELPEGLGVKADGVNVFPDSPHGKGHHTIFPTRDMSFDEFAEKFRSVKNNYCGKK